MEQLKIKMNEIEGVTLNIPTEFTGYSFNKFYEQLLKIGKSMPDIQLHSSVYKDSISQTPERLTMPNWQNEKECLKILKIWTNEGKDAVVKWIKEKKKIELTQAEISKLSGLIAAIRGKYKNKVM